MLKPIDDFKDYILGDVLGHVDGVSAKRMFGGYGLYLDGAIFGFITSDTDVCFKVNETNQKQYEEVGSKPFVYSGWKDPKRKPITMPYWFVPEEILEDREKIAQWVEQSAKITKAEKK